MRVGGLCVSAPAKSWLLQTTKFLPPYATQLPTSPSHATLRAHLGRFPSCSRWGPQKKGFRGLAAPPFSARGGRKRAAWRHKLQFPGPRRTLKWGKSGEASLAQPDVHPSKLPLRGILSCSSPGRRSARGGVGVRGGETLHAEVPFGCSGAGRSCPFSTRFSAASPNANEAPPPQSLSRGSLRSLYSRTSEPRHRMMESSRLGLLALPSPYAPPALETSSSAAPTRRGHQARALQTQLAKSLLPHWQAGFLSLAGGQGGWRKATGDQETSRGTGVAMAKGLFHWLPHPALSQSWGSWR